MIGKNMSNCGTSDWERYFGILSRLPTKDYEAIFQPLSRREQEMLLSAKAHPCLNKIPKQKGDLSYDPKRIAEPAPPPHPCGG